MSDEEIKHLQQNYYDLHEKYYKLQHQLKQKEELIKKINDFVDECCKYPSIDSYIDGEVYSSMTSDEVIELKKILKESESNE